MSVTNDIRRITELAVPVLVGQLAVIAFSVIDTIMAGRVSAPDLASIGLGGSIYLTVYISLTGIIQALAPIAGQLYGAGKHDAIGMQVRQATWLAIGVAIPGIVLLTFPGPLLRFAGAQPDLVVKAAQYLHYQAFGLTGALGFRVYTSLNNAMGRPVMVTALQLAGLAIKVPLNHWFIHGGMGLPAMGGPGCALASALISWLWCLSGVMLLYRMPAYRPLHIFSTWSWPVRKHIGALLRLGVPMGLTYLIEITSFTLMSVFITRMGTVTLAGHQIIANLSGVAYMLPLSMAIATSTLVAQAVGARDRAQARRIAWNGIRMSATCAALVGAGFWFLREPLLHAYSTDPAVIATAMPLVLFIAFYQAFDAVQVMAAFVLRAYRVAVVPTVIYALSLWGVGLGGGYLLGFGLIDGAPGFSRGPSGFWMANSISLAIASALLVRYFVAVSRDGEGLDNAVRDAQRLSTESEPKR